MPSERTRVSLKLVDTSLRLLAPSNPGSVITYIGETEFSTVVVGNAQETSFQLFVQNLSLLLIDNVSSAPVDEGDRGIGKSSNVSGVTFWKVRSFSTRLYNSANTGVRMMAMRCSPK